MSQKTKKSTYDRILDKSIQLFNKYGVFNVSVQRIASALKISPGNVTYHFKKKNDILHAILTRVEDEMVNMRLKAEDMGTDVKEHYDYIVNVHRFLWNYRFVFNNMVYLNSEDKKLGKRITQLQKKASDGLVEFCEYAASRGWMKPLESPNSARLLTENLFYIWLSWLRMSQIQPKGKDALLAFANEHFISFIQPYWNEKFSKGIVEYMQTDLKK